MFRNKKTTLLVVVLVSALAAEVAKANFVIGTPTLIPGSGQCYSPSVSTDGLSMYVDAYERSGGHGDYDIWVFTRETIHDDWSGPVNLGPIINGSYKDVNPDISDDGLTLFFDSDRPGSEGLDIWFSTRATINDPWSEPVNLGPTVNSPYYDGHSSVSTDGLSLFFISERPGGEGGRAIWLATRTAIDAPWSEPVNLGPIVNSPSMDFAPDISSDGRTLFLDSERLGGEGGRDIWLTTRTAIDAPWSEPVNLGPIVNDPNNNGTACISADGSILYLCSNGVRQVSIEPIVDLNSDGTIDAADMCIIVDHWGTDEPLCDIAPAPLGDGIVGVRDLMVLAEYLLPVIAAHWKLDELEGNIAYDSVGDHDGVLNGDPLWQSTSGKVKGALQLDGIDDHVSTPSILDAASGSMSAFAWIKGGELGQVILSQMDGIGYGAIWLCADSSGGGLTTKLMDPQPALKSEAVITDGAWHHIGLVWDGSCRYLYVDGAEAAKDAAALSYAINSDGGLHLGAGKALDAGSLFSGLIDDVRIYRRALTAEEIAALVQ